MSIKLALYTPPYEDVKSYFDMVDIASEVGVEYLETLNILDLAVPDVEYAKKLRNYADSNNVKFCCSSVGLNLTESDRFKNIETVKKFIDVAKVLGSPYLHHTIAFAWENPDEIVKKEDLYFERGLEAVHQICDYAKEQGIKILNEEQGFIFNGVNNFNKYVQKLGRDVGVVIDFGNIEFVDEKIEDFIPVFADIILHAHVKDYKYAQNEGYVTRGHKRIVDCQLGEGDVNIKKACDELKKIGYDGFIALECPAVDKSQKEVLIKNLNYMKECLK